jgi:hypothetical protein
MQTQIELIIWTEPIPTTQKDRWHPDFLTPPGEVRSIPVFFAPTEMPTGIAINHRPHLQAHFSEASR